jgi:hypothetical protein
MVPSEFPEIHGYPELKRLLNHQVDMQFLDLRCLLELPRVQGEGGCNFAAATVLFNIIAGSSVCFYDAKPEGLTNRGDRGRRFIGILNDFYPWIGETIAKDVAISILYQSSRNPLAHSLGIDTPNANIKAKQVFLMKWPLTADQIQELEDSANRPPWAKGTIVHIRRLQSGGEEVAISIPALYWGVHRMLHTVFADQAQVKNAEALVEHFGHLWDHYVSSGGAYVMMRRRRR